jgi:hypothetical protein
VEFRTVRFSLSDLPGKINPVPCNITNIIATAKVTTSKENILSCPSPLKKVLNPKGLIAKMIKPRKIKVSPVISLSSLRFSCEVQSGEELPRACQN